MGARQSAEKDVTRCEFQDCDAVAWRVLFWGPEKTAPARAACWKHEGETDLSQFRDRLAGAGVPQGSRVEAGKETSAQPDAIGPDARPLPPAVHVVADPLCDLHQEWPTKPDESARCETCRDLPPAKPGDPS